MWKASLKDSYEVRLMGLVSDVDRLSLVDLYQPLIGIPAVGMYLSLAEDPSTKGKEAYFEDLCLRSSMTIGQISPLFEALEATGLIKTYRKTENGSSHFVFCLYCPLDPKEFFDDMLFVGTLRNRIGIDNVEKLATKYKRAENVVGLKEITTSFMDYFHPELDTPSFLGANIKAKGKQKAKVKTGFDVLECVRSLSDLGIEQKAFSRDEIARIEILGALYGFEEPTLAALVSRAFIHTNPVGSKIDFNQLEYEARNTNSSRVEKKPVVATAKSDLYGNSKLTEKVKMMEKYSPTEWLYIKQGGHAPAKNDLKLVEYLALEMGLPFGAINALVDYVLEVNDNVLSRPYAEKVAAALVREGAQTALDAMDYLKKVNNASSKKKPTKEVVAEETVKEENNGVSEEKELDDIMEKLFGDKK